MSKPKRPAKRRPRAGGRKPTARRGPPARTKPSPSRSRPGRKPVARRGTRAATRRDVARSGRSGRSARAANRWLSFVEQQGVVLATARGPVPSVAQEIAGEPIVGSWWSHPKAQLIFDALSDLDDAPDVRCFKLVDGKVTLVHRRVWPALVKLVLAGVIGADRAASIQQEHMPTGEHRTFTTPFPAWVPDDVLAAAERLSVEDARLQLGSWT